MQFDWISFLVIWTSWVNRETGLRLILGMWRSRPVAKYFSEHWLVYCLMGLMCIVINTDNRLNSDTITSLNVQCYSSAEASSYGSELNIIYWQNHEYFHECMTGRGSADCKCLSYTSRQFYKTCTCTYTYCHLQILILQFKPACYNLWP